MQIEELYAAVVVSDMQRGEDFHTALLGRGPDDRPMDGIIAQIEDPDGNRLTVAEPPTGLS